jgi:MFS family permease
MNVTWSISDLLGPIIAGILADTYGWNPLFYSALLVSFVSIIPALFLGDSRISKERVKQEEPFQPYNSGSLRAILLVSFIAFIMCTGMGVVIPIIPLYLTEVFNISKTQVGLFLSIGVGLSTLLTQIPSGLVSDKYGSKKVMLLSALITPMLYLIAPLMGHYLLLAAVYLLIFASWSITWPSSIALLVDSVPQSKRSIAIGIRQTAIRLGLTIGPLVGGFLWHMYKLGLIIPAFLFYASAIFFVLSVPAILFLNERVLSTR